jgi:hypothetical protein
MQRAQTKSADRSINIEFTLYALDDPGVRQGNPHAANEAANGVGSAPIAVGSKLRIATTAVSKWRVFDAHGLVLVGIGNPFIGVSNVQHQCRICSESVRPLGALLRQQLARHPLAAVVEDDDAGADVFCAPTEEPAQFDIFDNDREAKCA